MHMPSISPTDSIESIQRHWYLCSALINLDCFLSILNNCVIPSHVICVVHAPALSLGLYFSSLAFRPSDRAIQTTSLTSCREAEQKAAEPHCSTHPSVSNNPWRTFNLWLDLKYLGSTLALYVVQPNSPSLIKSDFKPSGVFVLPFVLVEYAILSQTS